MIKHLAAGLVWVCVGAAAGTAAPAQTNAFPSEAETNNTVITSTRLNYDQQKHTAVFEENVVVTDPQIRINSDRLTVRFTAENQLETIESEGNVVIRTRDIISVSEKAVYDIKEAKVILSGNPRVKQGKDKLSAETITFWRNTKRILCEPNARLEIDSGQDIGRESLKGK